MPNRSCVLAQIIILIVFSLTASAQSTSTGKIVFHSDRSGNSEIYRIDVTGENETRLTNNDAYDGFPSWSPDGTTILFQSDRDGTLAVYSMRDDGSDPKRIPNTKHGNYPKWSADGSRIAFFAKRDGVTDLFAVNPDGDELENLTNNRSTDETPSWTADGTTVAFQSDRGWRDSLEGDPAEDQRSNYGIFTLALATSTVTEITGIEFNDENPSINPDGSGIVFQRYVDDGLAIGYIEIATGKTRLLTDPADISGSPAWSSGGTKIVFDSMRDGNFEIYVMDADGSNLHQITNTADNENSGAAMYDGLKKQ